MPLLKPFLLLAFLLALANQSVVAQSRADRRGYGDPGVAGDFDYYTLVLSWSPTHCATPEGRDDHAQCNRRDGRRYAFILHGLWPQYNRGYPANCRIRKQPFVPESTIDAVLDIMPSRGLIIHEYRKHGTCSGLDPDRYYDLSRQLFQSVKIPAAYINPSEPKMVRPAELVSQFTAANPQLKHDMIAVTCRGSGNRLRELRICFSKEGQPRRCGRNENQRSLCSAARMFVPPVRPAPRHSAPPTPNVSNQ